MVRNESNGTGYSTPGLVLRVVFLVVAALTVIVLAVSAGEEGIEPSEAFFWTAIVLTAVATMALFSAWFRRNG
ncbi:MAG: hypothetical protein FWF40_04480 [Methanomassiliicoccaceae archaeon]|nr:hypothetical protein [Methanomassiliicoccaceae archaeon]